MESSQPRDRTQVSCIVDRRFTCRASSKPCPRTRLLAWNKGTSAPSLWPREPQSGERLSKTVPLPSLIPSASSRIQRSRDQREAIVGPAVAVMTRTLSPEAHLSKGTRNAALNQVDREIRPISLAPERVGLQQSGAGQLGPHRGTCAE